MRSRTSGSTPAARSSSQRGAVRRSCHTIARWRGRPVHAVPHDDGLALVGDADRRRRSRRRAAATTSVKRVRAPRAQISSGSCSTHPGRGKCCGNSRYAKWRGRPSASTATVRTPVVPASMARTIGHRRSPQCIGEGASLAASAGRNSNTCVFPSWSRTSTWRSRPLRTRTTSSDLAGACSNTWPRRGPHDHLALGHRHVVVVATREQQTTVRGHRRVPRPRACRAGRRIAHAPNPTDDAAHWWSCASACSPAGATARGSTR